MVDSGGPPAEQPGPRRWRGLALAALVVLALGAGYRSVRGIPLVQDERVHHAQVVRLAAGRYTQHRDLTTLPGYHAVLAAAARSGAGLHRRSLRGVQTLLALGCLALFHLLARRLRGDAPGLTTLMLVTLPLLFPFFFLLYTDVLALAFVLGALALAVRGRGELAGLVGTLGVLVRQTNVVWLLFVCAFGLLQASPAPGLRAALAQLLQPRRWLRHGRVALAGLLGFAAFVAWNGGVAVGDQASHPVQGLQLSNVWLMLALGTALLLPVHVADAPRVARQALARPAETLLGLGLALGLYWLTFTNSHPYNATDEYLHNALLAWATSSAGGRLLFFVPVAWMLLSLRAGAVPGWSGALLGGATLVLVGSTWLVEPRYYVVPFALYLLLRRPAARAAELCVVAQNAALSAWLLWGIRAGLLFP